MKYEYYSKEILLDKQIGDSIWMSDKLVIFDEVQHKVLKIRIYPNQDQTILINKTFGSCRKLYNEHLQERNEFYIDNILPIPKEERQLKSKEVYKTIAAIAVIRIILMFFIFSTSLFFYIISQIFWYVNNFLIFCSFFCVFWYTIYS